MTPWYRRLDWHRNERSALVHATNTGNTPALKVRLSERALTLRDPCSSEHVHTPLDDQESEHVIAADGDFWFPAITAHLPDKEAVAVLTGKSRLFAYGSLVYDDVFGPGMRRRSVLDTKSGDR